MLILLNCKAACALTVHLNTLLPEKVACHYSTFWKLLSQHWGEFIVSLLSLSLLLEEKLVTFLLMYEPLKWGSGISSTVPCGSTVQPKNIGLLYLIFQALKRPSSKICCRADRLQRALGSCFPKAPSHNSIKNTLHNQKPKARVTEKRKTWRQKRENWKAERKKGRWWRSEQEREECEEGRRE